MGFTSKTWENTRWQTNTSFSLNTSRCFFHIVLLSQGISLLLHATSSEPCKELPGCWLAVGPLLHSVGDPSGDFSSQNRDGPTFYGKFRMDVMINYGKNGGKPKLEATVMDFVWSWVWGGSSTDWKRVGALKTSPQVIQLGSPRVFTES